MFEFLAQLPLSSYIKDLQKSELNPAENKDLGGYIKN